MSPLADIGYSLHSRKPKPKNLKLYALNLKPYTLNHRKPNGTFKSASISGDPWKTRFVAVRRPFGCTSLGFRAQGFGYRA